MDRARALFKPLKAAHDAHKKDPYIPDSSIWKRSKASLKYWNAKRKLKNCLSRYDRRQRNAYNFEENRQNALMNRLRPSFSKRLSDSVDNISKSMSSFRQLTQNTDRKVQEINVANVRNLVNHGNDFLAAAEEKVREFDVENVRNLVNHGSDFLAAAQNRVEQGKVKMDFGVRETLSNIGRSISRPFRREGGRRYRRRGTRKRKQHNTRHML